MRPNKYQPGDKLGPLSLALIERVDSSGRKGQFAKFRCRCGSEFTANIQKVKIGKAKTCGCRGRTKSESQPRDHLLKMIGIWSSGTGGKKNGC